MPTLTIHTPEGITLTREIAGAGSRFAAGLIDALILSVGYLAVLLAALLATSFDPSGASGLVLGILVGGVVLVFAAYSFVFHVAWNGETPGKRMFGLRVASAEGYPASTMQHLLRATLWPLDVLLPVPAPFGWLGLVLIAVTERRQRLGDLVAGTLVVREARARETRESLGLAPGVPVAPASLPPGLAARLSSEDFEFLRDLNERLGAEHAKTRRLIAEAASFYARELELPPTEDPRAFLRGVYLALHELRSARA